MCTDYILTYLDLSSWFSDKDEGGYGMYIKFGGKIISFLSINSGEGNFSTVFELFDIGFD